MGVDITEFRVYNSDSKTPNFGGSMNVDGEAIFRHKEIWNPP